MGVRLIITQSGQVTLQREALDHLGVAPGDPVELELLPSGRVELRSVGTDSLEPFFGCVRSPHVSPPSIETIREAIIEGWADKP